MKYFALILMILLFTIPARAADVSGNWTGTVSTVKGDFPIELALKVEGAVVTGTMLGTDGTRFKIEDGKTNGTTVTFMVKLDYPGKSIVRTYEGVLKGDEMKFTVDSSGQKSEFVVKRAK